MNFLEASEKLYHTYSCVKVFKTSFFTNVLEIYRLPLGLALQRSG